MAKQPVAPPTRTFSKPALTSAALLTFLSSKGLTVNNQSDATHKLSYIGYYRLKIYTRHFEDAAKMFLPGTTFDDIFKLYEFDRNLRLIALDAIERVEVSLRARIIDVMTIVGGAHFYYDERHFEKRDAVTRLRSVGTRATHLSIEHYKRTYATPHLPPFWCIAEASTFGMVSTTFADLTLSNRKQIASFYGLDEKILVSWFRSINTLRNTCAHHGRLWNATTPVNAPFVARAYSNELQNNRTLYAKAAVLRIILNTIDKNYSDDWANRLKTHITANNQYPLASMGFPVDWLIRPIWV